MFNNTFSINIDNLFEALYLSQFSLEISEVEKLGEAGCATILLSLIGSLTIGSYYKSALYWYMYDHLKGIKDRPIDLLLLLQAVIQHIMCLLLVCTYTIGLSFDITYSHHFGEAWCNFPWYAGVYGVAYRNVGGLVIATMRLLYIFCGDWMKQKFGAKRMLCVLSTASLVSSALISIGFGIGNGPLSRKQVTWNFCVGKSENFREILHGYSVIRGNVTFQHELVPKLIVLISIVCVAVELICYLVIFGHLYLHNSAMMKKKIMETEVLERRQQKNAITFLGQFWTFIVECIFYLLLAYSMDKTSHFMYRLVAIIGILVEFGFISIVEVMTSQNLRRYLPHNRLFR
jgi:hypothetical protein